jgi:type ISP restriction-modification system protein
MSGTALSDRELAEKYGLKDNRDWKISDERKDLRGNKHWQSRIIRCAYRPYDSPYCFFGPEFMDYARRELLGHVSGRDNISSVATRQIGTGHWRHTFIANEPANDCLISDESREANQVFPLWRFDDRGTRRENLSPGFRAFIDARYERLYTPKKSSATSMRSCTHLPIAPNTPNSCASTFPAYCFRNRRTISKLCWASAGRWCRRTCCASCRVRAWPPITARGITWSRPCAIRARNRRPRSTRLSSSNLDIGGYQVLDKYLKSRKGRMLSLDEINHVSGIADSLAFTIEQMAKSRRHIGPLFPIGDNSKQRSRRSVQ